MTARLILDSPAPGAWNMAVDEALLESAGRGVTTLRFYQWSEPTLSLGYFQPVADRQQHASSHNVPLVRRASGGGAILHDRELTYSFAVPMGGRLGAQAQRVYRLFHQTLVATLKELGCQAELCSPPEDGDPGVRPEPFLCFQRRTAGDVLCGSYKIGGSAQRRNRQGLLQHGSVLLARSDAAPELPGLTELAADVTPIDLASAWRHLLEDFLGTDFALAMLTADEESKAKELNRERFQHPSWNGRR